MDTETIEGETFEYYDENEVQNLLNQGWQLDADGLNEDEASQMIKMIDNEYRVFQREDGSCTILIKQMSAIDEMSHEIPEQNPDDIRTEMNNRYQNTLPDIVEDGANGNN
ncbi:hypothetical protein J7J83_00730 [bacterium]|nr:hypothetical protein [bacterium]